MDDNGFAYVFRGGFLLVLIMTIFHVGNAIVGFLPPIEDFFHNLAKISLILHAIPIVPWIYVQIVDPVVADLAPGLALSPQDALRIEERTGRYGSFFLLPYPKFVFGIFVKAFQAVVKFLYDVAFDFEETVLNHSSVYPHTIRLRNYMRSRLGQTPMPANRKRLRYTTSSTSTTITQAEIHRACMKPRQVCEDNLLLLRNAENEQSLVVRTRENEHEEERRAMQQQIATLQTTVQKHSRWDYSLLYRDERRHHIETREQLQSIREQLENTQNTYEALQDEISINQEVVEEERRKNAQLTQDLEAANATTNNDETRIQSLEQKVRRLNLLADNQRIQIESDQQELAQHVANQIRLLDEEIIVPPHIRVVLETTFNAAIEEKRQQIHAEFSQKFEEELQEHKANMEHEYSNNQVQSFAEETANIENDRKRLQAECENERQLIEVEKQTIQRAQDATRRDRQSIEQEKNRVDVERNHQFRLIEQEKERVQSDRAQLERDSQNQRQLITQEEQRMAEERTQIQSEFKKLQDERLRLEQDQGHVQNQMSEVSKIQRNTTAGTEEERRIAELEEEAESYEKFLHQEKSKDKTALREHQKLKEEFARMEAENQILKARISNTVATPSESRVGVMPVSVAPAASTQPESMPDTSAALITPMDLSDMDNAPAGADDTEGDPVLREMLQAAEAEAELIQLEEEAKAMMKDSKFPDNINGTEKIKNPFASTTNSGEGEQNAPKTRKVLQPRSLKTRMGSMYGTTAHETGGPSSQAPNDESARPTTARKKPVATGRVAEKRPRPTTARKAPYTLPPIDPVSEEDEDEENEEDQETENKYEDEDAFIEQSE